MLTDDGCMHDLCFLNRRLDDGLQTLDIFPLQWWRLDSLQFTLRGFLNGLAIIMWRTVTAIYTRLTAETWWQQFFRRLSNCDAPSQLILVLLTASLELLGFEIHSRQAISIPKRKVLLVSPLRRLAYRTVDRRAFVISRYRYPPPGKRVMAPANLE